MAALPLEGRATASQAVLNAVAQLGDGATIEQVCNLCAAWGTENLTTIRTLRELETGGRIWKDGDHYRRGARPAEVPQELVLKAPTAPAKVQGSLLF
jgi:hypothetical protein